MSCHVVLDARKLGDGGIGVYIANLVDGFLEFEDIKPSGLKLSLLVSPDIYKAVKEKQFFSKDVFGVSASLARWNDKVEFFAEPSKKYSLSEYLLISRRHRELLSTADVYHSPHYTLPYFLSIPSVVTVHDVIHVSHPDKFYHKPVAKTLISSSISRANHIVTVSEDSKSQIMEHFSGRTPESITVVPNALQMDVQDQSPEKIKAFCKKKKLNKTYALFIGSDRPHKGFAELLEAWDILRRTHLKECFRLPELVVVGNRFSKKTKELASHNGIRFAGNVRRSELSLLYSGAKFVVLPSRVEGFGLVALEAMALGVPVVSTPLACVKEFLGELGWYSEGFDGESIAAICRHLIKNPEGASRRADKGKTRAQRFSRLAAAEQTLRVYQELSKPKGEQPPLSGELAADIRVASGG